MVVQNKYKARESARRQSARGGSRGGRGRGRGGRVGSGSKQSGDFPEGQESVDVAEEEEEDTEFPSLQQATAERAEQEDEVEEVPRKYYGRRKIESNLWKFQQEDNDDGEEKPPEPEVDISNLIERVKQLDANRDLKAGVYLGAPTKEQEAEAKQIEEDIDHSLAYLNEREQQRQRARGRALDNLPPKKGIVARELDADEIHKEAEEREEMLKEKERSEALRALKERFQGRAVGERPREAKKITLGAPLTGKNTQKGKDIPSLLPSSSKASAKTETQNAAIPANEEKPKPQVESMQDFLDSML